jgi:hypothetical protein
MLTVLATGAAAAVLGLTALALMPQPLDLLAQVTKLAAHRFVFVLVLLLLVALFLSLSPFV